MVHQMNVKVNYFPEKCEHTHLKTIFPPTSVPLVLSPLKGMAGTG